MTTQPIFFPKIVHKITSSLSCPESIAQHRTHPKHFTRKRHLTFPNLVLFLLNQPNSALHAQMNELGLHKTWQGLRLLAVDGSSMHLPLEDPLARHFGTHNGLPVARVSVLQDLLSNQALHTLHRSNGSRPE